MAVMNFSECLYSLLSTLGISINRLAKAINVDSSLANRWVNGKRIPAYNTNYIEHIAEYLAKNIKNTLHRQFIDELFTSVLGYSLTDVSLQTKIERILLEAQGYSLEQRKRERKERKQLLVQEDIIPAVTNLPTSSRLCCPFNR